MPSVNFLTKGLSKESDQKIVFSNGVLVILNLLFKFSFNIGDDLKTSSSNTAVPVFENTEIDSC